MIISNSNTINKYELITESGQLKLDRVGYSSLAYPFAYGCIPRTWDEDGDPLDIEIVGVTEPLVPGIAYRFLASTMMRNPAQPTAQMLGDGLVPLQSAMDHGVEGDVARVELGGIGHMGQLRHAAVYAALQQWLRDIAPR